MRLQVLLVASLSHLATIADSFHSPSVTTSTRSITRSITSTRTPNPFRRTLPPKPETGGPQTKTGFLAMAPGATAPQQARKKRPLQSIRSIVPDDSHGRNTATTGDVVTIEVDLAPEDGFVPEPLFDASGELTLVLGWGNYLPGLHELLEGMSEGESIENVSVDAGFGRHNPEMVIRVPKANLRKVQNVDRIAPGMTLNLQGGIQVSVLEVTGDTITVDANHPLAGTSYLCNLTLKRIDRFPSGSLEVPRNEPTTAETATDTATEKLSPFRVATLAMGCFWGVELALMRTPGVVGTRAGYSQGSLADPTYEAIKEGTTGHREAVLVVYDPRVVSYGDILKVYDERLAVTAPEYFRLDLFAEDDGGEADGETDGASPASPPESQYRHGIYFHGEEQKRLAGDYIASIRDSRYCDIELLPATVFYSAEEHHQQYLYKGGQAARKGCRDTIRCYG